MLAAVLYGQEDLRLESVPDPTPAAGEIIIRVKAATTCGTDLKVWRRGGHARMLKPPTLFGHEAAGQIVALGKGVAGWQIGDRVVANNSAPCHQCFFCQKQEYSLCTDLCFNNGTFAEYLKIPAPIVRDNLLPIPAELPDALAALTEPLACVLHGVARSNVKPGDRVVVVGDGAIGLMFVAALNLGYTGNRRGDRQEPPEVVLFGGSDRRLEIGRQFGARTFNHRQVADIATAVKQLTNGWGADVVVEATGSPQVWETAIACARPGATVNLFGGCPRDTSITVSTEQLHYSELTLKGVFHNTPFSEQLHYSELTLKGVFHNTPFFVREALAMLNSRSLPFELLISDQQPLKHLEQVFCDMRDRKVIKVAIVP